MIELPRGYTQLPSGIQVPHVVETGWIERDDHTILSAVLEITPDFTRYDVTGLQVRGYGLDHSHMMFKFTDVRRAALYKAELFLDYKPYNLAQVEQDYKTKRRDLLDETHVSVLVDLGRAFMSQGNQFAADITGYTTRTIQRKVRNA